MEVGDSPDHGGTSDEMIALGDQRSHERDILRVRLDERVFGVVVVCVFDGTVFGVVIDPNDLVTVTEKFLNDVSADKACRSSH